MYLPPQHHIYPEVPNILSVSLVNRRQVIQKYSHEVSAHNAGLHRLCTVLCNQELIHSKTGI